MTPVVLQVDGCAIEAIGVWADGQQAISLLAPQVVRSSIELKPGQKTAVSFRARIRVEPGTVCLKGAAVACEIKFGAELQGPATALCRTVTRTDMVWMRCIESLGQAAT